MNANRFCVYEHWRTDTNTCFYVGKGTLQRAYQVCPRARNQHHTNVVEKLKRTGFSYDVKLVAVDLLEKDAFDLECERIKFWRNQDVKLANMTDGGEGPSGHKRSEETKAKMSAAHKGKSRPDLLGRKASDETKAKISLSRKGRKLSEETKAKLSAVIKGRLRGPTPQETKAKISAAKKGIKPSTEARAKLSAVRLGKTHSDETKAKMSAALKGRTRGPLSEEHKRKLSEMFKGKSLSPERRQIIKDSWARRKAKLAEVSICG